MRLQQSKLQAKPAGRQVLELSITKYTSIRESYIYNTYSSEITLNIISGGLATSLLKHKALNLILIKIDNRKLYLR